MMLLVSLAVLSLVFPARAEVPALITGTWRMTGTPRGDGDFLHDEFTQHANGSYTGKGWGTWSEDLTSGTNNYTYSGITSDAVCETDTSTGAVTHRSKWTLVEDWDLGANPMPDWNTPAGQKYVFCAYNTYDDATDIMKQYAPFVDKRVMTHIKCEGRRVCTTYTTYASFSAVHRDPQNVETGFKLLERLGVLRTRRHRSQASVDNLAKQRLVRAVLRARLHRQ